MRICTYVVGESLKAARILGKYRDLNPDRSVVEKVAATAHQSESSGHVVSTDFSTGRCCSGDSCHPETGHTAGPLPKFALRAPVHCL